MSKPVDIMAIAAERLHEEGRTHPAWPAYQKARRDWERLLDEAGQAHRRMEDAAEQLIQSGEMIVDYR